MDLRPKVSCFMSSSNVSPMRDCWMPKQLWLRLLPTHNWTDFWDTDTKRWVEMNFAKSSDRSGLRRHWKYIFRQAIQELLKWRNLETFRQQPHPHALTLEVISKPGDRGRTRIIC